MRYKVYIQNNMVSEIEANDTDDALRLISSKISNNEIVYDASQPMNLKLEPIHEQWQRQQTQAKKRRL